MFWKPKDIMKGKCYVFSSYQRKKTKQKPSLVYLECKLTQYRYGLCILKLKLWKTKERNYLETSKQKTRYRWCFSLLKPLQKGNNCISGLCKVTRKLQCMCLAFTYLKTTSEKAKACQKAKTKVRMMFFEIKMQEHECRWCNYKLNCKSSTNNLLRSKETINKVRFNRLQVPK